MKILALNTVTSKLSVALDKDGEIYSYSDAESNHAHSVKIMGAIDDVLKRARVSLNDIDVFSAVIGPGSFTGIRIGVSVINAFALAMNKPAIAVTIFDTVKYNGQRRLVMFNARHNNFYVARSEGMRKELLGVLTADELNGYKEDKTIIDENYIPDPQDLIDAVKYRTDNNEYDFAPLYMRETEAERKCK